MKKIYRIFCSILGLSLIATTSFANLSGGSTTPPVWAGFENTLQDGGLPNLIVTTYRSSNGNLQTCIYDSPQYAAEPTSNCPRITTKLFRITGIFRIPFSTSEGGYLAWILPTGDNDNVMATIRHNSLGDHQPPARIHFRPPGHLNGVKISHPLLGESMCLDKYNERVSGRNHQWVECNK